jgi:uncharacterized protein YqhQ
MPDLAFGGQALIEGVMMRGPKRIAMAVRTPSGEIKVDTRDYVALVDRIPALKKPILRGAVSFFEMMIVGVRALNYSASVAAGVDDQGKAQLSPMALGLTLLVSMAFGIGLFVYFPLQVSQWLGLAKNAFWFNLVAGGVRVSILVGYMALMLFSKELRRVFEYHGAEHKSIWTLENGCDLEVAEARRQTRLHPRCGTSFLLIVAISAVFLYAVSDSIVQYALGHAPGVLLRFATHFSLLPILAGASYEFLKLSGVHRDKRWVLFLIAPGLWLQRITTREPDDGQLEVALAALKAVVTQPAAERIAA